MTGHIRPVRPPATRGVFAPPPRGERRALELLLALEDEWLLVSNKTEVRAIPTIAAAAAYSLTNAGFASLRRRHVFKPHDREVRITELGARRCRLVLEQHGSILSDDQRDEIADYLEADE